MLTVRGLTKRFYLDGRANTLFEDLSFDLNKGGRLGLLGRNGQGKTTLIKMLGGVLWPTSGYASWSMTSSWPLGLDGGFQGAMTGYDNIKFIARIYQRDPKQIIGKVDEFADLGDALFKPMKYYSAGMRARLGFGLSLAIDFDCYLIDEIVAVGDALFREKCDQELFGARQDRAFIIASHDTALIQRICNFAIVIDSGRAKVFRDVDTAVAVYAGLCAEEAAARALDMAA
jgi:capsular polysaccharide transport system ATP-binding protein